MIMFNFRNITRGRVSGGLEKKKLETGRSVQLRGCCKDPPRGTEGLHWGSGRLTRKHAHTRESHMR